MSQMGDPEIIPIEDGATIVSQLQKLAHQKPNRPAYILLDKDLNRRVLTRQDVWDKSRKFAAILRRHGITKGDIVCNTLVNSPERLITCFGTMTAGAITMHGQIFRADGEDLLHSLKESKCKAILIDPGDQVGACAVLDRIKSMDEKTGDTRYPGLPHLTQVLTVRACGVEDSNRFITYVDEEEEMFVEESISQYDVAGVFTTSGTTGFSKLVQRTHLTLLASGGMINWAFDGGYESSLFNMQSMGWFGGFPYIYPRVGHTRICIDTAAGAPSDMGAFIIRVFNQEDVQMSIMLTRDLHLVLVASDNSRQLKRRLPVIGTGGGPIHNATMDAIGKVVDRIVVAYVGTEFGLVSCIRVNENSEYKDMCSGQPHPLCDVKIAGEDAKEKPPGQLGEILVRNQYLFQDYLNNPTKTSEAFTKDGWYLTGDMGYLDDSGRLFVLCRKADAITKAGFTHYPGWMEKLINEIPGIEKSVVIGVPDPIHHEEICLCMKLSPGCELTVERVRDHCKKLFLTDEKAGMTPLPQHYLFFDDFIMNSNGKVDRRLVKEEAYKRLNIEA